MSSDWFDRFGGIVSGVCALHCLILALVPTVFTLLGLGHGVHGTLEWVLFSLAVVSAMAAAVLGYRTHHALWVVAGFATGLVVLTTARMAEAFELFEGSVTFAVLGAAILVATHLASIRQTRLCRQACCS